MSAEVPSRTAFATSLASARVGSAWWIMDSSICVAVIAGFPCSSEQRMIRFWTSGTAAGPISTPRSPRATMTASEAEMIALQLLDGLGLLDLRDHERCRARAVQELAQGVDVARRAHERERDEVDSDRERELEVGEILLGERGDRDRRAWDVDALVRVDLSADRNLAARPSGLHLLDLQVHEAVVDEDVLPGHQDFGEHRRADGQVARLAGPVAREDDLVAAREHDRCREVADAKLRALQIGDQREWPAGTRLGLADEQSALRVVLVRAVREVEARRVHPGVDELVEHLPGRGGWADRADDLRAAPSERHASTLA